jgi:hypothetical protein
MILDSPFEHPTPKNKPSSLIVEDVTLYLEICLLRMGITELSYIFHTVRID